MILDGLGIEDFRCIERASLELHPRFNLVSGPNASGKTSLLEAVFMLGRGRSFRTAHTETLIRRECAQFQLLGRVQGGVAPRPLGMRFGREGAEIRYAGRAVEGLAELASLLPVQAIDPEVHRLIEGGPSERRRYLDWGVFHVEPAFIGEWRRFQRALRQRNAALKAGQPDSLVRVWERDLIEAGELVARQRARYVDSLAPHVAAVGERLLGAPVEIGVSRGWSADRSLAEAVSASWARDRERGLTHSGPHRADILVRFQGAPARDRISRGQQKLAAAALLLGQLQADAELGSQVTVLLVDDPAAELDPDHLGRLLDEVSVLSAQLVITALDPANPALAALASGHRFHVEHGVVTRLI